MCLGCSSSCLGKWVANLVLGFLSFCPVDITSSQMLPFRRSRDQTVLEGLQYCGQSLLTWGQQGFPSHVNQCVLILPVLTGIKLPLVETHLPHSRPYGCNCIVLSVDLCGCGVFCILGYLRYSLINTCLALTAAGWCGGAEVDQL